MQKPIGSHIVPFLKEGGAIYHLSSGLTIIRSLQVHYQLVGSSYKGLPCREPHHMKGTDVRSCCLPKGRFSNDFAAIWP